MKNLIPRLGALLAALGLYAFAQMPNGVQKDDWEEINFVFDSSVLTDGYPSLLRLGELLSQNPAYKVKVEGHVDQVLETLASL